MSMGYTFNFGEEDIKKFYLDKAGRIEAFPESLVKVNESVEKYRDIVRELDEYGVSIQRGFLDVGKVKSVGSKFEECIRERKFIGTKLRHHRVETIADVEKADFKYIPEDLLKSPDFELNKEVSNVAVQDPLINIPELNDIIFDERIIGVATAFYQAIPMLTFLKLRKSFANDIPASDTEWYHADGGSFVILKALVYFNDVIEGGGPFSYVKTSHRQRFDGWNSKMRFSDEEMEKHYGKDKIIKCNAKVGDVVFALTTGFHKGEKPTKHDRSVVIFNFCIHPEYGFEYKPVKISSAIAQSLPAHIKPICDGLDKI